MSKTPTIHIDDRRVRAKRDARIYGHFIEHFHRQIYGGIFEPGSPLSDDRGFRTDVVAAIADINPAILRWPGGCFVSAYHWKGGVGPQRRPYYDKAWLVEESNQFGTDEFVEFCKRIGATPYICTNGGSGTAEEMADWVEYCNLDTGGIYAAERRKNGFAEPHKVPIWSIGNENYGPWEIGAKEPEEWAIFVRESAKMMKAVDPEIELSAASIARLDWNEALLREAGAYLDWISLHHYWDPIWETNDLAPYETCIAQSATVDGVIEQAEHLLGALGYLGKIKIAFDEWNLRGWYHPRSNPAVGDIIGARDENDRNDSYTMADAVFSASFLNACLRHADTVKMANIAPTVNARGLIYAHPEGIVLRPTYHVFKLFAKIMGDTVVDSYIEGNPTLKLDTVGEDAPPVHALDAVATTRGDSSRISLINKSGGDTIVVRFDIADPRPLASAQLHSIAPDSKNAYNGVDDPDRVRITTRTIEIDGGSDLTLELPPHSVHVLTLT